MGPRACDNRKKKTFHLFEQNLSKQTDGRSTSQRYFPPLDPILRHINPVHSLTLYFLEICFNIIHNRAG
jgi:hypothetical protein